MTTAIRSAPAEHFAWIAERVGIEPSQRFRALEAFDEATGRILGMVGYDAWTTNSAQMHVALDAPIAARPLLWPAFHYLFVQTGRGVALGLVRSDNARSLRLNKHLGFREAVRIRDGFEVGVDAVLFEMRRDECRWLKRGSHAV